MLQVALATEDEVSEAVGSRLISEWGSRLEVGLRLRRGGYGYLRSRMKNFCEMARRSPVLVITELDRTVCPAALCSEWTRRLSRPAGLLLRVAVREIEAWLLADHDAIRSFFGRAAAGRLPDRTDAIEYPKEFLLDLALRAPRDVRDDLTPGRGSLSSQGLGYNPRLTQYVYQYWDPQRASQRSPSLARTRQRLRDLAPK